MGTMEGAIPEVRCRLVRETPSAQTPDRIRGPGDVFRFISKLLDGDPQENFVVIHLNTQHRPVSFERITRGILDASLIHPREVFRGAILASAAGIILAHNHPSGDPTPSPEDRTVTRQLTTAGEIIGIPVLDHVVVGEGRYVSISEEG